MELEKVQVKIKCDIPGCIRFANYTLKLRRFWNLGNTNFCKECLTKMQEQINKELTPKSPKNILTKQVALKEKIK